MQCLALFINIKFFNIKDIHAPNLYHACQGEKILLYISPNK